MPFTLPTKVICPLCFESFHLGFAPIREWGRDQENTQDKALQKFFGLPDNSVQMPPVMDPPGGFKHYLFDDPVLAGEKGMRVVALFCNFIIALYYGILWILRFFYIPVVSSGGKHPRWRVCPHCHFQLPTAMANRGTKSIVIAITGFRKVGKSTFIAGLIDKLKDTSYEQTGWSIRAGETFASASGEQISSDEAWDRRFKHLRDNTTLDPTVQAGKSLTQDDVRAPLIYYLKIKHQCWWDSIWHPFSKFREFDLAFYDAAGESLDTQANRANDLGGIIHHASGIIALIDPCDAPAIKAHLNLPDKQKPLPNTIGAILKTDPRSGAPLAVTLTKFDEIGKLLESDKLLELSAPLIHEKRFNREACDGISNMIVRKVLKPFKFEHELSLPETNFHGNHCFFAVSALGRKPNAQKLGGDMENRNVTDPLYWILYRNGILRSAKDTDTPLLQQLFIKENRQILRIWDKIDSVFRFFHSRTREYVCSRSIARITAVILCIVIVLGLWAFRSHQSPKDGLADIPPTITDVKENVMTTGLYKGDWKDGKWHGKGTLCGISDDGIPFTYTGDFADGAKHGQGKIIWANGDEYEGNWENGERHGQGRMVSGGSTVDGTWSNGKYQDRSPISLP